MFLKSIEMVGFKSFADRTTLEFEPGMSAIVGPNGCGKSNVADAVRWVLGEQRPTALRGANMVDCIFSGTEQRKPLGMAEVSLTFADCESILGVDYNEVTITRRVLRSGEGQYYINKSPCRLRDIQRLFMDTGIGTDAYSMMEQGRIDQILSSRPEDRRAGFEEASGITKYKADKREALRKLDHTEANLLRLADIIKEVKRQIISLQRQAGKARRYKEMHGRLRKLDLHLSRVRLKSFNQHIAALEAKIAALSERDEALRHDIGALESEAQRTRSEINELEERAAEAMEASIQAKTELGRIEDLIHVNRDRLEELQALSERDSRDASDAEARIAQRQAALADIAEHYDAALAAKQASERELQERTEKLQAHKQRMASAERELEEFRNEALEIESHLARLQNEITDLQAEERSTVIRRERLAAERAEMQRSVEAYRERQQEMGQQLDALRQALEQRETEFREWTERKAAHERTLRETEQRVHALQAQAAAKKAQIELLEENRSEQELLPGGARWLLNDASSVDRSKLLGAIAEHIHVEPPYRLAVEAALRSWLDAVVVRDAATLKAVVASLEQAGQGAARVLSIEPAADAPAPPQEGNGPGRPLAQHVRCDEPFRPLLNRLLRDVRLVDAITDAPHPIPTHQVYVSKEGAVLRGDGAGAFWSRDGSETNPLLQRHSLAAWEEERAGLTRQLEETRATQSRQEQILAAITAELERAREALDESRRALALREGESQIVSREAAQTRERSDTVAWELNAITEQEDSGQDRRTALQQQIDEKRNRQAQLRAAIESKNENYRALQEEENRETAELTELRIRMAGQVQAVEDQKRRKEAEENRISELEKLIEERRQGVGAYRSRMDQIQRLLGESEARVEPLQTKVQELAEQMETYRREREEKSEHLKALDEQTKAKRTASDELRSERSDYEVQIAEERMRKQNLLERVTSDYRIAEEDIDREPEPDWGDDGEPEPDALETTVAELRAKLESMGPVNLVAIEEHQELETRYAFLMKEQDDLLKAKQQLLDMIRKINRTTTEMFSETFENVNANFQIMFKQLFGGGAAKLVLLDEEDVLESGIEIIARPPGKKLQSVSLLSGGERTMTAVALLFALFQVKPSPFCLLDELDAALDDANIGRFIKMLQGFLDKSQFVIITHNRQTIAAADVLYGITMKQGVSEIISAKFAHHER